MAIQSLEQTIGTEPKKIDYSRESFDLYSKVQNKLLKVISYFNTFEFYGRENIESIIHGPAIIVSNHPEATKDVILVAELFKREGCQLFYGARSELFKKEEFVGLIKKHLKKHLNVFAHLIRNDYMERFAEFAESSLPKIGTISLDVVKQHQNSGAFKKMAKYLGEYDRKIVLLQFDKATSEANKHSIFHGAKKGAAVAASLTYMHYGKDVPVVPIGIYGTKGLIPVSYMITHLKKKPIKIKVGQPLYITSFLDKENPVESLRQALNDSIWGLIGELVRMK